MLKFTPFNSAVDASFWQSLLSKKLNTFKLSQETQTIYGHYLPNQKVVNEQGERIMMQSHLSIPSHGFEPSR